jgi:hypothetical protein
MFNVTRERFIGIRLTTKGLENLNAARDGWSRSEYVRQALAFAVKGGLRGPKPPSPAQEF